MITNELFAAYHKAYSGYLNAMKEIVEHSDLIKRNFEAMYPEYYISNVYNLQYISACVYRKSDNKIVDNWATPNADGTWKFKH